MGSLSLSVCAWCLWHVHGTPLLHSCMCPPGLQGLCGRGRGLCLPPTVCVCVPVPFATPACAHTSNGAMGYPLSTLVPRVTTAILGSSPLSLCAVVTLTAPPSSDVCRQWCGSAVGQWWVCHSTPRRATHVHSHMTVVLPLVWGRPRILQRHLPREAATCPLE